MQAQSADHTRRLMKLSQYCRQRDKLRHQAQAAGAADSRHGQKRKREAEQEQQLPPVAVGEEVQDMECRICLEAFERQVVLPCVHSFCKECIVGWLERRENKRCCPICRTPVAGGAAGVQPIMPEEEYVAVIKAREREFEKAKRQKRNEEQEEGEEGSSEEQRGKGKESAQKSKKGKGKGSGGSKQTAVDLRAVEKRDGVKVAYLVDRIGRLLRQNQCAKEKQDQEQEEPKGGKGKTKRAARQKKGKGKGSQKQEKNDDGASFTSTSDTGGTGEHGVGESASWRPFKCVVFSSWTAVLERTGEALRSSLWRDLGRLQAPGTGTGTGRQGNPDAETYGVEEFFGAPSLREEALQRFMHNPDSHVLLVSLRSSSGYSGVAGLTLTMASCAFLMEPVLNFGLEAQAIGRINRIGQTVKPTVERLVVADTVEDKVMELSARKQHLESDSSSGGSGQLDTKDIEALFGL